MDPRNPSVPDAQEFDAQCPGGQPRFIVFHRQATHHRVADWVMERTSDQEVMASGTLDEMLALLGTEEYPHSRRATHAEDMLRYRPRIFDLEFQYGGKVVGPLNIHRQYPARTGPRPEPRTLEEERRIWQEVMAPEGKPK